MEQDIALPSQLITTPMELEEVKLKTWDNFKEEMDYFLNLLKQDNLTEETKEVINKSIRQMIHFWANPIIYWK
ncbi:hypothetical protein [Paenibacillus cremeus]|uniref:Uncharacterized protein n=1 Tax=Paenibacillus cremeus TaxID=2163881 RepID=A0A559KCL2_9BACL|nr:hypothetical protein [Paenibacillus cremeus]TVY09872.1 hypothetical protein FPZ49_10900 [Paenibacillus cremeus]